MIYYSNVMIEESVMEEIPFVFDLGIYNFASGDPRKDWYDR